ncbi:MAG TPA: hypothetical protein PKA64_01805 [Myxococcota bacterium]|nr:hypothetical protein [Myxococcota bacterium]
MSLTIHCYEPQSSPREISIALEEPRPFAIYAMQDTLSEDAREMRSTVLRRIEEHPPPNCTLLLELEVRQGRPGELPVLRVAKVGGRATVELIRPDSRGRVLKNQDLKSGSRFEATLGDLRTVMFSLEIETEKLSSGRGAVAGARPTGSKAVEALGSLVWVVPNIAETLAAPTGKIIAWLAARAKKLGLTPAMISPAILMSGFMLAAFYVAYDQYKSGMDAQERLKALEIDFEAARAARDDAVTAEEECRAQRQDLVFQLDRIEESRKLQAEIALARPLAHAVSIEGGGRRMSDEATLEYDKPAWTQMHKLVVGEMSAARDPKSMGAMCLSEEEKLGQDLPKYMLLWHPSPDFVCPEDFAAVIDGVDLAGPWGLGQRVGREFGAISSSSDGSDPRKNVRWSAAAYTAGLRAVMETILAADTGDRPPVSPGQLHVWTLALFDAYNRMPSPAGGAMDRTAEECVQDLVEEVSRRYQPAEPGQPALPPIGNIASGDELKVTPTAGCPWPSTAINQGAQAALRAVRELALVQWKLDEANRNKGGDEG